MSFTLNKCNNLVNQIDNKYAQVVLIKIILYVSQRNDGTQFHVRIGIKYFKI